MNNTMRERGGGGGGGWIPRDKESDLSSLKQLWSLQRSTSALNSTIWFTSAAEEERSQIT